MTENQPPLNEQLKRIRKEQHITLAELAERIGSDKSRLSLIERGISSPSLDLLDRYATTLGYQITLTPKTSHETTDPQPTTDNINYDL